jgi:hypothetical protein
VPIILKNLGWIESNFDPRLAETFRELLQEVNLIGTQTGASGTRLPAPPNIRAISVTAAEAEGLAEVEDLAASVSFSDAFARGSEILGEAKPE